MNYNISIKFNDLNKLFLYGKSIDSSKVFDEKLPIYKDVCINTSLYKINHSVKQNCTLRQLKEFIIGNIEKYNLYDIKMCFYGRLHHYIINVLKNHNNPNNESHKFAVDMYATIYAIKLLNSDFNDLCKIIAMIIYKYYQIVDNYILNYTINNNKDNINITKFKDKYFYHPFVEHYISKTFHLFPKEKHQDCSKFINKLNNEKGYDIINSSFNKYNYKCTSEKYNYSDFIDFDNDINTYKQYVDTFKGNKDGWTYKK